jgi:hypothetical protein
MVADLENARGQTWTVSVDMSSVFAQPIFEIKRKFGLTDHLRRMKCHDYDFLRL